jgi:hypothetical protein
MQYLKFQKLPEDNVQAKRIARQAKMYVLIDGELLSLPRRGSQAPLYPPRTRPGPSGRHSWRDFLPPRGVKGSRREGIPARILLAHGPG